MNDILDGYLNLQSITIYADGTNDSSNLSGPTSCGSTTQIISDVSTLGVGGTASIDLTCLNAGETVVVDVNTVVTASAPAGYTIPNTATGTGTSLPGDKDSSIPTSYDSDGNSTGSDTPGDTGDDNGERDGSDITGDPDDYYDTYDIDHTLDMPVPVKSIVSTSETHTDDNPSLDGSAGNERPLVIGEIMRYSLAIELPEGTSADFVVVDIIPAGLSFVSGTLELEYLADNNATNVDATASTDLLGANSGAITLPAAHFTLVGQTLTIDLESPINNDSNDGNAEYAVLEFNVLVNNDATNQNTTIHDNNFDITVGAGANRDTASSNHVFSEVLEPALNIAKSADDSTWIFGQTVAYTLDITHTAASTTEAFDIVITDAIPVELTYASVDLTSAPGWISSYAAPNLTLSCLSSNGCSLPLAGSASISFTATVNSITTTPHLSGTDTATNTANMVWTSLPDTGTTSNLTGSDTPGDSGDADGERNGDATGENDYNDSDMHDGGLDTYALGNRVWFDTNNSADIDGSEVGVAGVEVHLYEYDSGTGVATKLTIGADGIPGTADDGLGGEVITDVSGYYLFDYLEEGDYIVIIPDSEFGVGGTLEGYYSSETSMNVAGAIVESLAPDPDNDTDLDDNGTQDDGTGGFAAGTIASQPVTLGPTGDTEPTFPAIEDDLDGGNQGEQPDGRANMTVDFGFYKVEIGNLVYRDDNANGNFDDAVTDILLNGVDIHLYNAITNALIASTTTTTMTTDGEYLFSDLPDGDYYVTVDTPSDLASTIDTFDTVGTDDNVDPNDHLDNNDNGQGIGETTHTSVSSDTLTIAGGVDSGATRV